MSEKPRRSSFDISPEQYHAGLDVLWDAIGGFRVAGVDGVFRLASAKIRTLEKRLEMIEDLPLSEDCHDDAVLWIEIEPILSGARDGEGGGSDG